MAWVHHANCDPENERCYKAAGKELGIRLRIGPPSSCGLSYMRGIYTEPLSRERDFALMSAYFRHMDAYDNDPFKPDRGALPPWLRTAWIVCGCCWVVLAFVIFSR